MPLAYPLSCHAPATMLLCHPPQFPPLWSPLLQAPPCLPSTRQLPSSSGSALGPHRLRPMTEAVIQARAKGGVGLRNKAGLPHTRVPVTPPQEPFSIWEAIPLQPPQNESMLQPRFLVSKIWCASQHASLANFSSTSSFADQFTC